MDEHEVGNDEGSSGDSDLEHDAGEDGKAYIIDAYAVVDTVEDTATSSLPCSSALRKLGDDLDMNAVAEAQTTFSLYPMATY